jgi:hypothetical protein
VSDLQKLERNGVTVDGSCIKGTVVAFCADNLGAYEVGGFTQNFTSSDYFFRYCQISRETFMQSPTAIGRSWTPEIYDEAASNGTLDVKSKSVLNSLSHFHVSQPGLAPCLGRDLLEGIVPIDLALCIRYFIKHRWLTISELNNAIQSFR